MVSRALGAHGVVARVGSVRPVEHNCERVHGISLSSHSGGVVPALRVVSVVSVGVW